jgi:hypothetical protein
LETHKTKEKHVLFGMKRQQFGSKRGLWKKKKFEKREREKNLT